MNKIEEVLNDELGLRIIPYSPNEDKKRTKIDLEEFAKTNALLANLPLYLKDILNNQDNVENYRVIFDKGLGQLQHVKDNPNLYRGNVVAFGTNNKVVGEAILEKIEPNKLSAISNVVASCYALSSIVTNQYYLNNIYVKFQSIDARLKEITTFLELDKESAIWANAEFLKEVRDNLAIIKTCDSYKNSTLTNVQKIRIESLANSKLFYERLKSFKTALNAKDKEKEFNDTLAKYREYLPKFWYSVYTCELAYYLEASLSDITSKVYFDYIKNQMTKVLDIFDTFYYHLDKEVNEYIKHVKALKPNEFIKVIPNIGLFLSTINPALISPLLNIGVQVLGQAIRIGGKAWADLDKNKKEETKNNIINELKKSIKPYADTEPFLIHIKELDNLNKFYNQEVQLLVEDKHVYLLLDESAKKDKELNILNFN